MRAATLVRAPAARLVHIGAVLEAELATAAQATAAQQPRYHWLGAALARLIDRTIEESDFYQLLRDQCAARAPLFAPAAERAALLELVDNLLNPHQGMNP